MPQLAFNSPIGSLAIAEEDGAIVSLDWGWPAETAETPLLHETRRQLEAYFAGDLRVFDLPLAPFGTPFQKRVWERMQAIGYGRTSTYGAVARELGSSPRAVGGACGRNPIPVIIPCHRILATDGGLGGYSGLDGIDTKTFLLRLEGVTA